VLDKYRIEAIVLTTGDRAEDELIPWVREHYGPGTKAADARVWRLRARELSAPVDGRRDPTD
jgi:hypothetical protein